ncbi:GatB/YqeY domain-containing protein [Lophiostoma macrostomum CBS 122681]|uniref:Altered inheritance of mitochondria protein 41 n=1 Tax=Lophiostoma macrostomum CBS 122681 TaxID=1314788 RepID=A0A6A6TDC8_9PLEO|nr:GatB/YqeY domain-containing protein [Lophiostoma macrostomum CBS 122681]
MSLFRLARPRLLQYQSSILLRAAFTTSPIRKSTQATQPTESQIIPRIKSDIKDALRAKNKPRLDVLRQIHAKITDASKTDAPITRDGQLLGLLQKQIAGTEESIAYFAQHKRDDLRGVQEAQLEVLNELVAEIPKLSEQEIDQIVDEVVAGGVKTGKDGKPLRGQVMGQVMQKVAGRPVDMKYVLYKIHELSGVPQKG